MKAKYPSWEKSYRKAYLARTLTPEKKSARATSKKRCPSAQKEYVSAKNRAYFLANPEKYAAKIARQRRHYRANREHYLAKIRQYRAENRDKILAQKRTHYFANIQRAKARRKAYYAANRKRAIAEAARWQKQNPEKMKRARRIRYIHPDCPRRQKAKIYSRRWIESGKSKIYGRKRMAEHRANLTDFYVRQQLAKRSTLRAKDFPSQLVELKREQLKLKLALK